jgi:hypothetical protein
MNLYVVLERELPGVDSPDWTELSSQWFEKVANQAGVNLLEFMGQDPSEFFDEGELGGLEVGEKWFEAREGLEAVGKLLAALEPTAHKRAPRAIEELRELEAILITAEQNSARFYLALDI